MECWNIGIMCRGTNNTSPTPSFQYSNTPLPHFSHMEASEKKINPILLAQEIIKFRKEKHPFGYNYAVKIRMGHAEIQDLTAIADILSAIEELGYTVARKPN
jgi:hypothetical protein